MTSNTHSNHEKALHVAAVDIAKQSMCRAAKELRSVVTENEQFDAQTALEVEVSCDGSCHRRGHSSLYGLAAVISALQSLNKPAASIALADPSKSNMHLPLAILILL